MEGNPGVDSHGLVLFLELGPSVPIYQHDGNGVGLTVYPITNQSGICTCQLRPHSLLLG